ncbi:metallophosphoesterase [Streptomyces sp. NBC_00237]|uniref:metallophosphoesterase n=1 Tax=Streptomyces sp. NBC_00237 TaxID=2975687 RepID=UPI002258608C|nr:metallophosphoesterase [Streptomyces sp. NBC_00237]MCX5201508.1 metallophosphoesterase [Streptomyces sp. NBC_00237]
MKRICVISDVQIPYHNAKHLKNLIDFIGDFAPDELYQIGDLCDYPTPSRWSQGTRLEYEQHVRRDSETTKRVFLEPIRKVYSGPFGILEGNHDLRPRTYLSAQAPALAEYADSFHFRKLLDFDGFGVDLTPPFFKVGPDTALVHGHEIKGLSQEAGKTALRHALKADVNIVMGHTHRLGVQRVGTGYQGGRRGIRWGMEVGHLMSPAKAGYLGPGGVANWQPGFSILYISDKHVAPVPVDIARDGSFIVEGALYGGPSRGPDGKFVRGVSL